MLPKTHFILTSILAIILLVLDWINSLQALAILFGGFLIDTDHYFWYVYEKKNWNLKKAYKWHIAPYIKPVYGTIYFHAFHTIEAFIIILLLGFLNPIFFYIFIGMVFHLILDALKGHHEGVYGKRISVLYYLLAKRKK